MLKKTAKTQLRNRKMQNCEHADDQRENKNESAEIGKGGFVRTLVL